VDIREQVKEVIINKSGIAKSADFVDAGIRAVDVVNLCNTGFLNRIRHGYYELAKESTVSESSFSQYSSRKELYALNQLFFIMDTVILYPKMVYSNSKIYVKNKT
jgi:hypothetical protein